MKGDLNCHAWQEAIIIMIIIIIIIIIISSSIIIVVFYHYCSNQDEFPFLKEVVKLPKSPKDWNLANLYVHSELS